MLKKITPYLKKDSLAVNMGIYTVTTIINRALPFLLIPILTRYLNATEYGYVAMFQVFLGFSYILVGNAMTVNISKTFYSNDKKYIAKLVSNIFIALLFSSTFCVCVLFFILNFVGNIFNFPEKWLYLLPVIALFCAINLINWVLLRNQKKSFTFGIFQISNTALNFGLSLVLIILFHWGWEGRVVGIGMAFLITGSIGFIYFFKSGYFKLSFDRNILKKILVVTLPLIPNAILIKIIEQSGKIFIDQSFTKADVGLYNIGLTIGMIVYFIALSFFYAWEPWLYENLARLNRSIKKKLSIALVLYCCGLFALSLAVSLSAGIIIRIMTTPDFYSADIFVKWIAFGYAFWGCNALLGPFIINKEKQNTLMIFSGLGATVNILCNYFFIKYNGSIGVAQAFFITYLLMFSSKLIYVSKIYEVSWISPLKKTFKVISKQCV